MAVDTDNSGIGGSGSVPGDDLSALSWVQEELRRSLEAAHKALRRYLKEHAQGSDLDSVDPAVLRQARSQYHQSVGVLELVGLGPAANVLRASEAALLRLSARPKLITAAAVESLERGAFALLDFIGRRLAGKPVSTLSLFPQYRVLQELAGANRAHPADLWGVPWSWRELDLDPSVAPRHPDDDTTGRIESDLLALMRGAPPSVAARMSDRFAELAAGAQAAAMSAAGPAGMNGPHHRLATLWQLAAAFFEAQADGLLQPDAHSKRMGSKLLGQLRAGELSEPSERLAHDLLFFCGQAVQRDGMPFGHRLAAVRTGYALPDETPVDYEQARLGRFDPALVQQAHKRVQAAKEVWSAVAGGDTARLSGLAEQFALVSDSLARLYPGGDELGRALQSAAGHAAAAPGEPPAGLAMEVATALLYLDASLDDGDFDHPDSADRVHRLAQRIEQVRQSRDPGTLELWMEELYRRVSDRQTMGSVVQELRASLSEVETHIDHYFRDPSQREVLIPVPAQLSAMRGVLSVLGLDQASQAVLRMRDDVDALANTEVDPQRAIATGTFDRLADNLGALSFLIDMVSVQPQMAKSLFRFDPATGNLSAVMAREERPTGFDDLDTRVSDGAGPVDTNALAVTLDFDRMVKQARAVNRPAQSADSDATDPAPLGSQGLPMLSLDDDSGPTLRLPFADAQVTQRLAPESELPAPALPALPQQGAASSGLEDDPEMREIFLEEAREVVQTARLALSELQARHDDVNAMTTVRRAFHTLKGSARMVGLSAFGEAAWACEQLYNSRLADHGGADHDLRGFSSEVVEHFGHWVEALAAGQAAGFGPDPIVRAADALRTERRRLPLSGGSPAVGDELALAPAPGLPAELATPTLDLRQRVPDLPLASDLDLTLPEIEIDLAAFEDEPSIEPTRIDLPPDTALSTSPVPLEASAFEPEATQVFHRLPVEPTIDVADATELDLSLEFDETFGAPGEQAAPVAAADEQDRANADADAELAAAAGAPELGAQEPDEAVRQVGPLRISIPLFNIYLGEADELSRRLGVELAEWALEQHRPVGEAAIALAHSLAGSSGTVGFADLSQLARALEHALERSHERGVGQAGEADLFNQAANEIRRLLHLFAAGFLNAPDATVLASVLALAHAAPSRDPVWTEDEGDAVDTPAEAGVDIEAAGAVAEAEPLMAELPMAEPAYIAAPDPAPAMQSSLADLEQAPLPQVENAAAALGRAALLPFEALPEAATRVSKAAGDNRLGSFEEDIDQTDAIDPDLLPIFTEEVQELLPRLQTQLRAWAGKPADADAASACMRSLHTLKGSARLAGAMRLGELAHRLESAVQQLAEQGTQAQASDVDALIGHADTLQTRADALLTVAAPEAVAVPATAPLPPPAASAPAAGKPGVVPQRPPLPATAAVPVAPPVASGPARSAAVVQPVDWQRFVDAQPGPGDAQPGALVGLGAAGSVRVRTPLLDRLVNQAGEVSIARSRIESDVAQIKGSLGDLTDNLERLRAQLRDIELQAETQIDTRMEAARAASQAFDPLEMDRFTRFQELTRMMAESVADVATVQRGLQRTLQSTEDSLAHQARMTRDMQDDLLRTRMVEFEGLSERLYRVVRQAAKETGKPVRLDIVGGSIEIDRGVLDRMTAAFEHLLRNSVVHGIEPADVRAKAGKDATGTITLSVTQVGNEVGVEVRDDGAGLNLPRIRERGLATGLIAPGAEPDDATLANLVFQPGFTTASSLTGLAGRGVGMDVVRTDVNAMGGRIETASAPGQGTSFRLVLPLTTAVTQVVMLRCGERSFAVPSTLIEIVRRVKLPDIARAYETQTFNEGGQSLPFFWLDALLGGTARGRSTGRTAPVVVIRSAAQRVVLHVDEVLGNQEVVVKNLGPQLSRVPGLVGMTLLPSGLPALIYNPVALATLYGDEARQALAASVGHADTTDAAAGQVVPLAPLVVVVDDSLTVRRITQRLLEREGYRVTVAKDGLDGLDKLAIEVPAVLLTDIEMPRMDGFDLVRNLRADARLAHLPVVMITSRIAQKHRDYAAELGVDHYLGKPYAEDELLGLVARYARRTMATA